MEKIIRSIIYIFTVSVILSGCSTESVKVGKKYADPEKTNLKSGVVAENETYLLEWVEADGGVVLTEKSTGNIWSTTAGSDETTRVDEFGMPVKKNPQLRSAIFLQYYNLSTKTEESVTSYVGAVSGGEITVEKIKNGIKVGYYFAEQKIMIPVQYVLRNDSLAITVDPNEIQEAENQVNSVSIAPFICSSENDKSDSYLFYPSGSGALISCDTLSQSGANYSSQVYGKDFAMQTLHQATTEKSVRLPVYGAKSGETGCCAIIENAAESASIVANVGSSTLKYSNIYTTFQVRGYTENMTKFFNNTERRVNVYAKSMVNVPMTVAYYPLTGQSANYVGMAQIYKRYLKTKGMLSCNSNESSLNFTFLGGTMVQKSFLGIPYKDLFATTTVKQVGDILNDISANTGGSIKARLLGFGKSGTDNDTYAGDFRINKKLGTVRELSELNRKCQGVDIELFFDIDLIKLKNGSSGYSTFFDTAQSACHKVADAYDYNVAIRSYIPDSKYSLISRKYLADGADKMLKAIDDWGISCVSMASLSSVAYSDYSDKGKADYYSKGGMETDVTRIMNNVSEKYKIAVDDANAYAACSAEVIFNSPTGSSEEKIFCEDVPFYQMIFKGSVPLCGESINLSDNPDKQILKSVESGSGLNYILISNYSDELISSNEYSFFGSKYSDIKEDIFKNYNEFNRFFQAVKGAEIFSHSIAADGTRRTSFDNGVTAIVNYTNQNLSTEYGELKPMGYVWGR